MKYYVYYLKVEGEDKPFYVGKSFVGSKRLTEHLSDARKANSNILKCNKIRKAWRNGKRIVEIVVATVETNEEANIIEKTLIAFHGRKINRTGILTNLTDGGDGSSNTCYSIEARKKMSDAKLGNKLNVGRKRPDMAEKFSKPVIVYTKEGKLIGTYPSAREIERQLGVDYRMISSVLRGRNKSAKSKNSGISYKFKFGIDKRIIKYGR